MSNEAISNQEHAKRIAYIEEQIRIIDHTWDPAFSFGLVSFVCFSLGVTFVWYATVSQLNIYLFVGASTIIVGIIFLILGVHKVTPYTGPTLAELEIEFAAIATPEDWMRKPNLLMPEYVPELYYD